MVPTMKLQKLESLVAEAKRGAVDVKEIGRWLSTDSMLTKNEQWLLHALVHYLDRGRRSPQRRLEACALS
jgi:hypothetical protein